MIIATAREDDLTSILALERAGFEPPHRWSEAAWAAEITAPDRLVLLGREGDEAVAAASFQVGPDVADVLRVVVSKPHRGRGCARRLMLAGVEWARATGVRRMLLEVAEDNPPAIQLYAEFGFQPIARRPSYYDAGRDALVMELELAGER